MVSEHPSETLTARSAAALLTSELKLGVVKALEASVNHNCGRDVPTCRLNETNSRLDMQM